MCLNNSKKSSIRCGSERVSSGGKPVFIILATALWLLLSGAPRGFAQCSASASSATTAVRTQGTAEILGTITIACNVAPVLSVSSNISLTLGAGAVSAVSGSTTVAGWTTTCSAVAPDLKTRFPCPSLSSTVAPVGAPTVTVNGSSINFNFTPGGGTQTFTITGIRMNVVASGVGAGIPISATVAAGGGLTGLSTVVLGIPNSIFGAGTGFSGAGLPLNISGCTPPVMTPFGTPSVLSANPDPSPVAANSLKVSLTEGFLGAFVPAATADNGVAGTQGIRFRIQLSGIPNGMSVYAPEVVSSASAAATGSVTGGGAATVVNIVAAASADGSGGAVLPALGANRFDLITTSSGSAMIVYEVTIAASLSGLETVNLFVALTIAGNSDQATISGAVGVAPVSPTANGSLPQFMATAGAVFVASVTACPGVPPTFPQAPAIVTPAKISFIVPSGSSPDPQPFDVLITGTTALRWSAVITSISGGSWLSLSPISGTGNTRVTATLNSSTLALGSYSAVVTFTADGASNSPSTMTVTLDVAGTLISAAPAALTFNATVGSNPSSQQVSVTTNAGTLNWTTSATVTSGGNWLSVSPGSGSTPGAVTVSVNAAGMLAGTYRGTVTIASPGAGNTSATVAVTLNLTPITPAISAW